MGNSKNAPAELMKDLVERDLMEKYHWTPKQIKELDYIWVQKYYLFDRIKKDALDTKSRLDAFKQENSGAPNRTVPQSQKGKGKKVILTGNKVVGQNQQSNKKEKT